MRMSVAGSNRSPAVPSRVAKEKKEKIFYEHGRDALELALSVANMQEEKALRKAEKHQPQGGKSRAERKNGDRASDKKKRLDEVKAMLAKRRAEAKKEKARSRKESKGLTRQRDDARILAQADSASAAPRKRVSFA